MIKAGEMVHVGMRDEDVAHPQKLAGRQTRDVADVKQDRPPLELQVDEYPRVAEGPVDQRRVENGPHLTENTIRGPSEFARHQGVMAERVRLFAAAPRILRFAPDRRVRVVQNRWAILSNPGEFFHTSCTAKLKGPEKQALYNLVERVGFEPTVGSLRRRFSSLA